MRALTQLSLGNLDALAEALAAERIDPSDPRIALARLVGDAHASELAPQLVQLAASGMKAAHIAHVVRAAATERRSKRTLTDRLALVWTVGEEAPIAPGRQTAAVVRQLFASAEERVLVTTYSVDWIKVAQPEHHPFAVLAARMGALPDLKVRLAINVARRRDDDRPAETLVKEFVQRFPTHVWPGARLPQLYFHPEGPQPMDREERACLHAKCVVVDGKTALVTSANFSDAAHERNVELGVRIDDAALAASIEDEIDRLIAGGVLVPLG